METNLYNQKGDNIGKIKLPDSIFGLKLNMDLLYQVVTAQRANKRQIIAHAKGRNEVRGGGKKPWRQKGRRPGFALNRRQIFYLAVLFCFAYGITDEYHQGFIAGREVSYWDLAFDVVGGMFGAMIYFIFSKKKFKKSLPRRQAGNT